ncbi:MULTISPECIES: efflux RND transporter permease subunit [Aphanothece]|uniref:efflux RND transporter permease subunit n=1 Tax=Aphanothece stagnina TaxID=1004305 RepID=UPI00398502F8
MNISRLAIRYPRITIGFWIAVVIAGLVAFGSLRYALFPDITFPVVVVHATVQPTPSTLATETALTIPIEAKLRNLADLDDVTSTTSAGRVTARVSFQVGKSLEEATQETLAALGSAGLPENTILDTVPLNLNESAAVSYVIQSSTRPPSQLVSLVEKQITPMIQEVNGVLRVRQIGALERSMATSDAIADGASAPMLARWDGRNALALEVVKTGDANTLELVQRLDLVMEKARRTIPDIEIIQAATQANYIREANLATLESIAIAVALSVIVIYPFLWNWKATLIAALAIPTSLFGTFIVMAVSGFDLETITLLAIALVVGIIVDDAIVDVENISRHLDLGKSPREAAITATDEVSLTVTSSTLTIAAVFLPVGLMGGVVGQFFRPFGLTVSAAVLISLLVARTLSPVLAMYWLRSSPQRSEGQPWQAVLNRYRAGLHWALRHRGLVVALTFSSLLLGVALVGQVDKGFIPRLDRGEFIVRFASQPQPSASPQASADPSPSQAQAMQAQLLDTQKAAERIEALIRSNPDVKEVYTTVGSRWGQTDTGELLVRLKPKRENSTLEIQDAIRTKLASLDAVKLSVEDIPFVDTGSEQPIQVRLFGEDIATLEQTATVLERRLSRLPGLVDVSTTANTPTADAAEAAQEHRDGRRVRYVRANLLPGTSVELATSQIRAAAKGSLPNGVTMELGGDSARIREILSSFALTLGLGIGCMLAVLVVLYRSWSDPLIIMVSLPLSFCGAMVSLLLTGQEFGMISVIGVIFLMGLTDKNAIIMIDYINQLRACGQGSTEAIISGATVRLRPILMTSAATVLGMLPVALGLGAGSELRAPMAIAIIGGLITSTLLSLIVIPVMVSLLDRFKRRVSAEVVSVN